MYMFGAVFMHRTGEVAWEKQLLSLSLERAGNLTRRQKKHESIAYICLCWQLHVCNGYRVNYEEYMLQVEEQVLTATIMTWIVGTAPLKYVQALLCRRSSCLICNSWQMRRSKRKLSSPYTDAHFVSRSKYLFSHAQILVHVSASSQNSIAHTLEDKVFTSKICGITKVSYNSCFLSFQNLKYYYAS